MDDAMPGGWFQAVAGVFAAVAGILFSVITGSVNGQSEQSNEDSAYAYFSVACVVIILCLISVYFLNKMVRNFTVHFEGSLLVWYPLFQPFMQFYFEQTSVQLGQQKQQKAVEAAVQTKVKVHPSYLAILKKVHYHMVGWVI